MFEKEDKPEDIVMSGGRINRTGARTSPIQSRRMLEAAKRVPPSPEGDRGPLNLFRADLVRSADPIGTVPPPSSLEGVARSILGVFAGKRPTVFIDKLGARLAFERTGTRIYETLLLKFDVYGSFQGGPTRDQLHRFYSEEFEHFRMLEKVIDDLGADPTAMTPSADIEATESYGLLKLVGDQRTTFMQSLHAVLVAELADEDSWSQLVRLAREVGQDDLAARFEVAHRQEVEHLTYVRAWVSDYTTLLADREVEPMAAEPGITAAT